MESSFTKKGRLCDIINMKINEKYGGNNLEHLGKYEEFTIVRNGAPGYYLDMKTGNTSDDVLLPHSDAEGKGLKTGDKIKVFIYKDSKNRPIATIKEPLAEVGDIAYLEVVDNTSMGSFINIGVPKDILIPMAEKKYPLIVGKKYLFYIYIDKSERIAATTDIESYLEIAEGHKIGDEVEGIIYDIYDNNSVAVAVEGKYRAVMLKNEYYEKVNPGDKLKFKVKRIYEDGNLGLTIRITGKEQRNKLQEDILEYLKENNGFMPLNDYSSPEDIRIVFKESKNYFKRALGGLMKKGLIEQTKEGTKLIEK